MSAEHGVAWQRTRERHASSWKREQEDVRRQYEQVPVIVGWLVGRCQTDEERGEGAQPERVAELDGDRGAEHGVACEREARNAVRARPAGSVVGPRGRAATIP